MTGAAWAALVVLFGLIAVGVLIWLCEQAPLAPDENGEDFSRDDA